MYAFYNASNDVPQSAPDHDDRSLLRWIQIRSLNGKKQASQATGQQLISPTRTEVIS